MELGLSTYSFQRLVEHNQAYILEIVEWIADNGGDHIEITPVGYSFLESADLVDAIRQKVRSAGIVVSNYAIMANFIQPTEDDYEYEIRRVMKEVDIAYRLGAKFMRHDVAWRPIDETSLDQFEEDLPKLVGACQRIADYAAKYDIITSVENHGYYIQKSDRVQRLVRTVDRKNFKTTLDVGNFLCVDEEPLIAVKKNLPISSLVHLKDFYVRPSDRDPGEGWFRTSGGNFLRGAILAQGDIDMWKIIKAIKSSGYDGYISIEFEGMEECMLGAKISIDNARRIWDQA